MKALSVWQPWASLIADQLKRYETRSWSTQYRGPLLICASTHRIPLAERLAICERDQGQFWLLDPEYSALPFGCAVCVVDVTDCFRTESWKNHISYAESLSQRRLGDFSPGRFAWDLQNVRKFTVPFPVRGRQGLFDVDDTDIAAALRAA